MPRSRRHRLWLRATLLAVFACGLASGGSAGVPASTQLLVAGSPNLSLDPMLWAKQTARTEEEVIHFDKNFPLRYRTRKRDAKGEMFRQVVESREGTVARLLQRDGQRLTAEENTAEQKRLSDILDSPDAFLRHEQRDEGSRSYAVELLQSMPQAMLWSYAPGQPQFPGAKALCVVLDFTPDPHFKPPSLVTEALTGIAGRVWVDAATQNVVRIEGRILHPVNFGWGGVLARVKEGGHVEFEQHKVNEHRWLYTHVVEHLTIREVLVHTVEENTEVVVTDAEPLPAPVSYRQAIQMLLAQPVPTR